MRTKKGCYKLCGMAAVVCRDEALTRLMKEGRDEALTRLMKEDGVGQCNCLAYRRSENGCESCDTMLYNLRNLNNK